MFTPNEISMKKILSFLFLQLMLNSIWAQNSGYWQQKVDYSMQIEVDETKFQYDGQMQLKYENHSPDDLDKVYFHLYYNAFQPGSAMDMRLQNIKDPDSRMMATIDGVKKSRISLLGPNDMGYQQIQSIQQNGKELNYKISGTIMEVSLNQPLKSGQSTVFNLKWKAQIPPVIRRGGKNSKEGVDFSMTQWYPKMAHYDRYGWHLDEYIGREFVAPFGNFDVKINIQKDYVVGASGKLQNPNEVKGYVSNPNIKAKKGKATWHFKAENIHDFAWAADKSFVVSSEKVNQGPIVYFIHQNETQINENWNKAKAITLGFFEFMSQKFGAYPWETYTIVQGGDGGMEYGTVTLVTGGRNLDSLVGVIFHEVAHSWYQQMFGINETVDEWMDEGFTSYGHQLAELYLTGQKIEPNPNLDAYNSYFELAKSGIEEPMSLLADYYNYNYAYSIQAYVKGQVYLIQLGYIIGDENLDKTFHEFYNQWKFKHPHPSDFSRIAEKISGLNLKWYDNLFINTTRTIDYRIKSVNSKEIELENLSNFAMPIDLLVEYTDGSKELFYIPNLELRGEKTAEDLELYKGVKRTILKPWAWTQPHYSVPVSKEVKTAEIDPTKRLADVDDSNNIYRK